MAASQDQTSPLLALPPELRNQIYTAALTGEDIILVAENGVRQGQPGLLRTCRGISDALQLYYTNTFRLTISDDRTATALAWLQSLVPDQRGAHIGGLILTSSTGLTEPPAAVVNEMWGLLGREVVKSGLPYGRVEVQATRDIEKRVIRGCESALTLLLLSLKVEALGLVREIAVWKGIQMELRLQLQTVRDMERVLDSQAVLDSQTADQEEGER
ncbi:hypothetical protein LTR65_007355 [Meristemomyces frigidus]